MISRINALPSVLLKQRSTEGRAGRLVLMIRIDLSKIKTRLVKKYKQVENCKVCNNTRKYGTTGLKCPHCCAYEVYEQIPQDD